MPDRKVITDICGKDIFATKMFEHRQKCYVKDIAYGFTDATGKAVNVLNGQVVYPEAAKPVEIVTPEES